MKNNTITNAATSDHLSATNIQERNESIALPINNFNRALAVITSLTLLITLLVSGNKYVVLISGTMMCISVLYEQLTNRNNDSEVTDPLVEMGKSIGVFIGMVIIVAPIVAYFFEAMSGVTAFIYYVIGYLANITFVFTKTANESRKRTMYETAYEKGVRDTQKMLVIIHSKLESEGDITSANHFLEAVQGVDIGLAERKESMRKFLKK